MDREKKAILRAKASTEENYVDFSEYDDGHGNNVDTGDSSMHELCQRGIRRNPAPQGKRR